MLYNLYYVSNGEKIYVAKNLTGAEGNEWYRKNAEHDYRTNKWYANGVSIEYELA